MQRVLSVFMCSVVVIGCKAKTAEQSAAAPAPEVLCALPIEQMIEEHEDFTGRTEAVESIDVRARATGYLEKANFDDGAFVKRGEVLFEIDDRPYKADLARALASLIQAEVRVNRLDRDHRRNVEAIITKAIAQAEYDKGLGDLDEAKANVEVAKANLKTAEYNLAWTRVTAFVSGRISKRMRDPGNIVKADETLLTNIVVTEPYMYATFDIDERTVLKLRSSRKQGRLLLSQDNDLMRFLGAGTIGYLGSPLAPGPFLAAAGMHPARFGVLPFKIGLADQDDYTIDGKLNFVDNRIDTGTGTLRVRGEFNNSTLKLHPGLFIRVRLPVGDPRNALLVAERAQGTGGNGQNALGNDQGQKYVYVVDKNNKIEYRRVKLGPLLEGGMRVIDDGIKPGERIVVNGLQRVRNGMVVRPTMVKMTGVLEELPKSGAK